ncbi:MAG: glycine cleavage system protein GcvH [candidate division WS1 bacterium]|jgi:glycine cleavage system H protein|nr:glycine cleavage system protein GcvH [candidate division WS1 bacterium]
MSSGEMLFDESHMWVRLEDDDTAVMGLSDYAQDMMGEVIFVELPEEGAALVRGDACGTVESVKSVEDLIAPASGEVVRVNEDVLDAPELMNQDATGDGWLMEVKLEDVNELDSLMTESEYETFLDNLEGEREDDDEDF